MKSLIYVINENYTNIYRIFSITKYEIIEDNRDSRLGILWKIIDPLMQIFAYWFAFGVGIRGGKDVNGIPYINWMLAGIVSWFFLSASIRNGVNCIHKKTNIITKMKFPISILPTIEIAKQVFNHIFMLVIVYIFLLLNGTDIRIQNLNVIYYLFCGIAFSISFSMVLSVLNMFTRDIKKMVNASMRLLMYVTPILWTMDKLTVNIQNLMKLNPLYYVVEGYRNSFFSNVSILERYNELIIFWSIVIGLFILGSILMYKFKQKFIDLI